MIRIQVCRWWVNMNYPHNWPWLLQIVAMFYGLIFHRHPQSCIHQRRSSADTRGMLTSLILVLLILLEPHVFVLLPSCRLCSHWVSKEMCAQGKSRRFCPFLSLSLSTLPVLFSQGLVLVLIKAVSFLLLPAFSTACCELRGNRDTKWGGMRWWRNPEGGESKFWVTLPSSYAGNHATSPLRPDAWNRVIIWHSMVLVSFTIFLQYAQPATSTAAPPPCRGIWFEGVLGGEAGLLAVWA